jgi:mitochondrial import inner membrane translocase subunit TIM21
MYTEVFSPDSKVNHFSRAVKQVKEDPRCTALLGNSKKITAYGEPTWNKWARARPIAYVRIYYFCSNLLILRSSRIETDRRGVEHLIMHFNVSEAFNLPFEYADVR